MSVAAMATKIPAANAKSRRPGGLPTKEILWNVIDLVYPSGSGIDSLRQFLFARRLAISL